MPRTDSLLTTWTWLGAWLRSATRHTREQVYMGVWQYAIWEYGYDGIGYFTTV